MSFRNRLTSLSGDQITPGTISGSILETAGAGQRVVITPDDGTPQHAPAVQLYTNDPDETLPASVRTTAFGALQIDSPQHGGEGTASLILTGQTDAGGPDSAELFLSSGPNLFMGGEDHAVTIAAGPTGSTTPYRFDQAAFTAPIVRAGNRVTGHANVKTTTAGVPASITMTGLDVQGTNLHATLGANTTVPGTVVTGVAYTDLSNDSITVWACRTTTATTGVDFAIEGN